MSSSRLVPVQNWRSGQPPGPAVDDRIAAEVPVALTYNRVSHVVMMATPLDLEDFALGFSLTEGLIGEVADLLAIRVIPRAGGLELKIVEMNPHLSARARGHRLFATANRDDVVVLKP